MTIPPPPLLRVRRQLSAALYGQVLECELPGCDEPVAVKWISLSQASERRNQTHATREIDNPRQEQRVAALLVAKGGHRNIVQPYFHFVQNETLYLVNEFCGGGDLHSLVAKRLETSRYLEEDEVVALMQQVLAGVQYLHTTLGIAHRDLSLENVLISHGVCKITDFGLSTDARRMCDGCQVGKEFYMAPEIVAGSPLLSLASPSVKGFKAVVQHGVGLILESWGHSSRISRATISVMEKMLQIDPQQRISLSQVLTHPVFHRSVAR